jgi:hypothetical protein
MKRLKKQLKHVKAVADRDLRLDAIEAAADATPAGTSLANAIDKSDRSCMAALKRLEARQKPGRRGPDGDPKKPVAAADGVADLVEPGQAEPGPELAPAAVAADADAPLAPEVPASDPAPVTMTRAAEPGMVDDPGLSAAEAVAEKCGVEPISVPASSEAVTEKCGVESISVPASSEAVAENRGVEPISVPRLREPDFERFDPEAERPRNVHLMHQRPDQPARPPPVSDG